MSHKKSGYDFYNNTLNAPKYIVAPMVDQSELAWRIMSRNHGADLCYTPMLNAKIVIQDSKHFRRDFQTNDQDHPVIAQFCGNDAEIVLEAARLVESKVDGVDLNLGCPQNIAKRGRYGSYLQDDWNTIRSIISTLHRELSIPVTAKIRIFEDLQHTIKYAEMVRDAGAQILTVHGRTREQRGQLTGLANWDAISAVRQAITDIPVFGNGNILYKDNIDSMMLETKVDAVMTAEGNLYNPAIFEDDCPLVWDMVSEYLDICQDLLVNQGIVTPSTCIRAHLFKMYRHAMPHFDPQILGTATSIEDFRIASSKIDAILKDQFNAADQSSKVLKNHTDSFSDLTGIPPWFCRSFIRPTIDCAASKQESTDEPILKRIKIAN